MKYRVLKGAAPEIYGNDVKEGDTISLTKTQAAHLIAKGHLEEVGSDEAAPASPAPAEKAAAALMAPAGDHAPRTKGSASGNRD